MMVYEICKCGGESNWQLDFLDELGGWVDKVVALKFEEATRIHVWRNGGSSLGLSGGEEIGGLR